MNTEPKPSTNATRWRIGIVDHTDFGDPNAEPFGYLSFEYATHEEALKAAMTWNAMAREEEGMWADIAVVEKVPEAPMPEITEPSPATTPKAASPLGNISPAERHILADKAMWDKFNAKVAAAKANGEKMPLPKVH